MIKIKHNVNKCFYIIFLLISSILIIFGIIFTPSFNELKSNFLSIFKQQSLINQDYFEVLNIGQAFIISGFLVIAVLLTYYISKVKIDGTHIAAIMMVLGFSFFGKNIFNVWPLFFGVILFAKVHKREYAKVINLAWFSTALSPIVGYISFDTSVLKSGSFVAILIAIFFGVISGYLIAIFADHGHKIHQNLTLYNAGFVAGIVALIINSFLKAIGFASNVVNKASYLKNENFKLSIVLFCIFLILFLSGLILNKGINDVKIIFKKDAKYQDFVLHHGLGITLVNMSFLGTITTLYVLLVGGHLNGSVYAAIFTVTGFSAYGMTIFNITPIILGSILMSFLTGGISSIFVPISFLNNAMENVKSNTMLTTTIFGCGLSPFVGHFGVFAGVISGAFNSLLLPNVSILYGWMSLYNNGFSTGLTSIILFPIFENIYKKRKNKFSIES